MVSFSTVKIVGSFPTLTIEKLNKIASPSHPFFDSRERNVDFLVNRLKPGGIKAVVAPFENVASVNRHRICEPAQSVVEAPTEEFKEFFKKLEQEGIQRFLVSESDERWKYDHDSYESLGTDFMEFYFNDKNYRPDMSFKEFMKTCLTGETWLSRVMKRNGLQLTGIISFRFDKPFSILHKQRQCDYGRDCIKCNNKNENSANDLLSPPLARSTSSSVYSAATLP